MFDTHRLSVSAQSNRIDPGGLHINHTLAYALGHWTRLCVSVTRYDFQNCYLTWITIKSMTEKAFSSFRNTVIWALYCVCVLMTNIDELAEQMSGW